MDAHQFFRYGSTGLSYTYSQPTVPSIPSRLLGSLKIECSPNSPSVSHLDCDTVTTLSDSQEQHSSTENYSGFSPSLVETNSNFHILSPSLDYCQENAFLHNANNSRNIKHVLHELENVLMGPDGVDDDNSNDDHDEVTTRTPFGRNSWPLNSEQSSRSWSQDCQISHTVQSRTSSLPVQRQFGEAIHTEKRHKIMEEESWQGYPSGNLKQLLIVCAKALAENNINEFEKLIEKARGAVSITGEPIQRLGAYMVEGLVARNEASGTNIYRALRCREPESKDLLSYMHNLYEICPYLKFGYLAANGAIAEACRTEHRIHIIDFQIAQGTQWVTLLQALAARPGGAPHVRITGIDDPVSQYARGDNVDAVERRLAMISEKFNIPIEFHVLPVFALDVTKEMLNVRPGEALAVNFPLQLHHTPDESVDVNNPRDGLLRMVKSLSPKVTTLVEQESNTNTTPFFTRFIETLNYYMAMFESIDETLPRDRNERINVEQHCLARDIVNVIACEGKERVERHELFGKWKSRMTMAGFQQFPLSSYVNSVISSLLKCYSKNYKLEEKDGALLLGWNDRNLIAASAWQ